MTIPERRRGHPRPPARHPPPPVRTPLRLLLRVASVACGVQFGWALQLSLLTPYVQELGIPHKWASLIWLCGPVSGLVVQPLVGHMSDRCGSSYGRRRPFIAAGTAAIALAVVLVGFSADIGGVLGDNKKSLSRPRAIAVFVLGFWVLDVGNNATQGPCRALLADLTVKDTRRTRVANAYFSLFMAVGNILGFAAGSYSGWYSILPFTVSSHCGMDCANLKSAFLLHVLILALTTYISLSSAKETPLNSVHGVLDAAEDPERSGPEHEAFFWELLGAVRYLSWPMWIILFLTALTWIAWFPFLLFDTDWMGREIYHGEPGKGHDYHSGVRMGALGLMLNSILLGCTSVGVERLCRKLGAGLVWGVSNLIMSICFVAMLITSYAANNIKYQASGHPPVGIVIAAILIFFSLGAPLAITYSVPYALISTRSEGLGIGQGLAMGILNLAIVLPQILVSLGSGPWDQLFGGGNSPAFAVAAVASFVSGIVAILAVPRSPVSRARIFPMDSPVSRARIFPTERTSLPITGRLTHRRSI